MNRNWAAAFAVMFSVVAASAIPARAESTQKTKNKVKSDFKVLLKKDPQGRTVENSVGETKSTQDATPADTPGMAPTVIEHKMARESSLAEAAKLVPNGSVKDAAVPMRPTAAPAESPGMMERLGNLFSGGEKKAKVEDKKEEPKTDGKAEKAGKAAVAPVKKPSNPHGLPVDDRSKSQADSPAADGCDARTARKDAEETSIHGMNKILRKRHKRCSESSAAYRKAFDGAAAAKSCDIPEVAYADGFSVSNYQGSQPENKQRYDRCYESNLRYRDKYDEGFQDGVAKNCSPERGERDGGQVASNGGANQMMERCKRFSENYRSAFQAGHLAELKRASAPRVSLLAPLPPPRKKAVSGADIVNALMGVADGVVKAAERDSARYDAERKAHYERENQNARINSINAANAANAQSDYSNPVGGGRARGSSGGDVHSIGVGPSQEDGLREVYCTVNGVRGPCQR